MGEGVGVNKFKIIYYFYRRVKYINLKKIYIIMVKIVKVKRKEVNLKVGKWDLFIWKMVKRGCNFFISERILYLRK